MESTQLQYVTEPPYARFFWLYLLIVCCILLAKATQLAWRLFRPSGYKKIDIEDIRDATGNSNRLARTVLANKVRCEPLGEMPYKHPAPKKESTDAELRRLQVVENKFWYIWQTSYSEVASLKRLVVTTWFACLLTAAVGTKLILLGHYRPSDQVPLILLRTEAITKLVERLSIGVLVCIILHLSAGFFESVMICRRATAKFLFAKLRNDVVGGPA